MLTNSFLYPVWEQWQVQWRQQGRSDVSLTPNVVNTSTNQRIRRVPPTHFVNVNRAENYQRHNL